MEALLIGMGHRHVLGSVGRVGPQDLQEKFLELPKNLLVVLVVGMWVGGILCSSLQTELEFLMDHHHAMMAK